MRPNRTGRPRANASRRDCDAGSAGRPAARLLIVDEHPIVGVGLRALFANEPGITVDTTTDPSLSSNRRIHAWRWNVQLNTAHSANVLRGCRRQPRTARLRGGGYCDD